MTPSRERPPESRVGIRRLERHADARGWVVEPLEPARLPDQRNVHVVVSEPGAVRGNHLHRRGTEVLAVEGPALVRWREEGELRDVEVDPGEVVAFTIPPGIPHAVRNTGSQARLIIAFRDVEHTPDDPDTERVVLLDPGR